MTAPTCCRPLQRKYPFLRAPQPGHPGSQQQMKSTRASSCSRPGAGVATPGQVQAQQKAMEKSSCAPFVALSAKGVYQQRDTRCHHYHPAFLKEDHDC